MKLLQPAEAKVLLPYVRSGTISAIAAGEPMLMLDGTPALNDPNIVRSDFAPDTVWVSRNNPTNTYKERLARRIIIHNLFTKYKIPSVLDFFNYHQADNTIRSYADQINKFHALSY